jgi:hypothetical protein
MDGRTSGSRKFWCELAPGYPGSRYISVFGPCLFRTDADKQLTPDCAPLTFCERFLHTSTPDRSQLFPTGVENVGVLHLLVCHVELASSGTPGSRTLSYRSHQESIQIHHPRVKELRAHREARNMQNAGVRVQLHTPCWTLACREQWLMTRVHQNTRTCVPEYKGLDHWADIKVRRRAAFLQVWNQNDLPWGEREGFRLMVRTPPGGELGSWTSSSMVEPQDTSAICG